MNAYPRRILQGMTPLRALAVELDTEFDMPTILGGPP
jgi:hypothetical protein